MEESRHNKITDVKGISVGHVTIDTPNHKTGVTVIMPVKRIYSAINLLPHVMSSMALVSLLVSCRLKN